MGVRVRKADASEASELTDIALDSKSFWGYSPAFIEACRSELQVSPEKITGGHFRYYVADRSGEILGFYALALHSREEIELEALFIVPKAIGKGVGRLLIEHAKQEAFGKGYLELFIQGDPHAEKFYLAAGAEKIGEKESGSIQGRMLPLYKIKLGTLK